MTVQRPLALMAITLFALASCQRGENLNPVSMSIIGTTLKISDPNMGSVSSASKTLLTATAQGLVTLDASGQVAPGLAQRWTVTDDGLSLIFRIRPAHWPDKLLVSSQDVSRSLRRSVSAIGRNPLRAQLGNVAAVIPMTPEVVEIRLRTPDPYFLQILAQPEMAILRSGGGTGPFRVHSRRGDVLRLRPVLEEAENGEAELPVDEAKDIRVRSEKASVAIARFEAGQIDYVTGGSFADAPFLKAAKPDAARIQVDPAKGLFGLLVSRTSTVLASNNLRLALSLAIDRDAIFQRFGIPEWRSMVSIVPPGPDSLSPPAALADLQQPIAERRSSAVKIVAEQRGRGDAIKIKVALPAGPGAHLLFASIANDWKRIGVTAIAVPNGQPADLKLIDEIAPSSNKLWYLQRLSCRTDQLCSPEADAKLASAMAEVDPVRRRELIAAADSELVQSNIYLPIALPLRWSLVSADFSSWKKSSFAHHPLTALRQD